MAGANEKIVSGWGRAQSRRVAEFVAEDLRTLPADIPLSRGLGRSYGDASLPPHDDLRAINTTHADRILNWDPKSGVLRGEAGLSLQTVHRLLMPQSWFSPVSPGTEIVTLGGMVAADVHGKNQHVQGDFGDHVRALRVRLASGEVVDCSPQHHTDLFWATVGGMGLTAHILEVEFALEKIPSRWIWQESQRIDHIDAFEEALEAAAKAWPYTAGWIDGLSGGAKMGRGILMRGRWANPEEVSEDAPKKRFEPTFPFDLPSWALNRASIAAFNYLYYWKHWERLRRGTVDPQGFFYPLDAIQHWNRMYGRRGFTQYQCVVPRTAQRGAARRVLEVLTRGGGASFLCVIKDFGRDGHGLLSFPMPGITLALDIAVRDNTQALIDALNEQVLKEGGRIYLAKDSFTRREHFVAMEKDRLEQFNKARDRFDPKRQLRSALSQRLLGDS